ncbi:MAG: spore coat protein U domain-containing protein [Pseudomonadota bacterium]
MQFNFKKSSFVLAFAVCGSAFAADDSATFGVSASIAAQCVVGNTTAMAFEPLSMLNSVTGGLSAADDTATATFDATCTNGSGTPNLTFTSANGDGAFALMGGDGSGNDLIAYSLYEGASTSIGIGHDTPVTFADFAANGVVKAMTVTGKIAPGAKNGKPVGTYNDTVTITVGFTADGA